MKKYTIIYSEVGQCGSHSYSIIKFDRIETDNLAELLKQEKYISNTWFVFEGWPKQEGEE